jgi:hypothetical protein
LFDRKTPLNVAALRHALEAAGVEFIDEKSAVMEVISVASGCRVFKVY